MGHAYIGVDAWAHLEKEAGGIMAKFIERYVRIPISEISAFEIEVDGDAEHKRIQLLDLEARMIEGDIVLKIGKHKRLITRVEDATLINDEAELNEDE